MDIMKNKASSKCTGFHVPFKFFCLVTTKHGLTLKITETSNQPLDNSNNFMLQYVYFKSSNHIQFNLLVSLSTESWLLKNSNIYYYQQSKIYYYKMQLVFTTHSKLLLLPAFQYVKHLSLISQDLIIIIINPLRISFHNSKFCTYNNII